MLPKTSTTSQRGRTHPAACYFCSPFTGSSQSGCLSAGGFPVPSSSRHFPGSPPPNAVTFLTVLCDTHSAAFSISFHRSQNRPNEGKENPDDKNESKDRGDPITKNVRSWIGSGLLKTDLRFASRHRDLRRVDDVSISPGWLYPA